MTSRTIIGIMLNTILIEAQALITFILALIYLYSSIEIKEIIDSLESI